MIDLAAQSASEHVRFLLCDADGTLFPSEEPAFDASADVVNRLLAELGASRRYSPGELQAMTNGKNFRAGARELAARYDRELDPDELARWAAEEMRVVTAHLREVLMPDPQVSGVLRQLRQRFELAIVTSSALTRLDACLEVTQLTELFPESRRFSAENSLAQPTSKPDPAIYSFAGEQLGITPEEGIALEDSINGALSAVEAGYATVGVLAFVPQEQRAARTQALTEVGAVAIASSWAEVPQQIMASGG